MFNHNGSWTVICICEKKVVCLDGTHGLNGYDFELVTLLVNDDYGSGFLVVLCLLT